MKPKVNGRISYLNMNLYKLIQDQVNITNKCINVIVLLT